MNRTQQLKLLNDKICRLFNEGVSEQDTFDQLSADQRFESIRRTSVQSLYKKLQKDQEKKQLDEERKRLDQYRQNARDLLVYDEPVLSGTDRFMGIWQNRYIATTKFGRQSNGTRVLNFHDLLQNSSKQVLFQPIKLFCKTHTLRDNLILLEEESFPYKVVRLARINLSDGSLQVTHTLQVIQLPEHNPYGIFDLIVDSSDPSKFLLVCANELYTIVISKVVDDKIIFDSEIELEGVDFFVDVFKTYFNDQLLVFKINEWTQNLSNASIAIHDLDPEENCKTMKLEPLPSNVYAHDKRSELFQCEWSRDHLFLSVQFRLARDYGIVFADPQTRNWTLLEFSISLPMKNFLIVNKNDLLVYAEKRRPETKDYLLNAYKLPMRKPELLRYKAWIKTVMFFKKKEAINPYEEARNYLPLNSDIQGLFAADQDDDE